ncbi:hypothetical protein [Streptomyces sp. YS-3]|uniref:hypothetical protein n=1 Tax=Streptomyces sp. YS-3 TaxID=3381352 RepID=UPI00386226C0
MPNSEVHRAPRAVFRTYEGEVRSTASRSPSQRPEAPAARPVVKMPWTDGVACG